MIDFELLPETKQMQQMTAGVANGVFRPISRYYDTHEHEKIKELYTLVETLKASQKTDGDGSGSSGRALTGGPEPYVAIAATYEELAYGDVGIMLAWPQRGLGNAAIDAVGTPEQKKRFGHKFTAMAITEPNAGSDTASISTTAKLDPETNEWILNGEKIFITSGYHSEAVVCWATLDKTRGRAAIKSFVVEKGTPGMTVTKVEKKLGIRASDTASIVLEDCRIPYDNILGTPEIADRGEAGIGGVMKTFDATRPGVSSMAIGVARAALEFTKEKLQAEGYTFPYNCNQYKLSSVQKSILEMEADLEAARLLNLRAAAMLDSKIRNSLEASMAKAKAGRAATIITQKCVEILGPIGYSRENLVEKWMRDSKITDIFEGTGQIQMLIVARNILGYSREMLK